MVKLYVAILLMLNKANRDLFDAIDHNSIVPVVEECDCFLVFLMARPVIYCVLALKEE